MKSWYEKRHLHTLIGRFERAVVANDAKGAGAIYGCLFDLLQTARLHSQSQWSGYRWKRMVAYLETELDAIQVAAKDYPMPIQQAIVAKVILYQESKKAS